VYVKPFISILGESSVAESVHMSIPAIESNPASAVFTMHKARRGTFACCADALPEDNPAVRAKAKITI